MNTHKRDEININRRKSMPYEQFFGEMNIPAKEKKERIELAKKFEDLFLYLFLLLRDGRKKEADEYYERLIDDYISIAVAFLAVKNSPAYLTEYANKEIGEIRRVTNERSGEEFFTSVDRAVLIAENEANTIGNYRDHIDHIKKGYKYKTWSAIIDTVTRESHIEADGQKVSIFEPFDVNGYQMNFPRDTSLGADMSEIANCRCVAIYSKT